jgi:hypothetical protein
LEARIQAADPITLLLVVNDLTVEVPYATPYITKEDLLGRIDLLLGGVEEKLAKRALKRDREHRIIDHLFAAFDRELGYKADPTIPAKGRKAADADHFREVLLLIRVFCYQYSAGRPEKEQINISPYFDVLRKLVRKPSRTAK